MTSIKKYVTIKTTNEREVMKMSAWTKVVGGYIATNKGVEYFAQENGENIVLRNNKNNDVFFL